MVKKQTKINEASEDTPKAKGNIIPSKTWLNTHGNAVFLNMPKEDVRITKSKYGDKVVLITSLDSLKRLVDGEIAGVNLGRFED